MKSKQNILEDGNFFSAFGAAFLTRIPLDQMRMLTTHTQKGERKGNNCVCVYIYITYAQSCSTTKNSINAAQFNNPPLASHAPSTIPQLSSSQTICLTMLGGHADFNSKQNALGIKNINIHFTVSEPSHQHQVSSVIDVCMRVYVHACVCGEFGLCTYNICN